MNEATTTTTTYLQCPKHGLVIVDTLNSVCPLCMQDIKQHKFILIDNNIYNLNLYQRIRFDDENSRIYFDHNNDIYLVNLKDNYKETKNIILLKIQ